jgi:aerobic-type carbon monoxide dehydrogenase small subunit (CoxS/CutS family)
MITLSVNGERQNVDADPAMPLLWALRDLLKLKGTKYACGAGLCGSCTVHVDGEPARSCITTVGSVAGKAVTTIEGLAEGETLHPVQAAWIEANTPQCGYCHPGQIMSAVALLERAPRPTDEEIDAAMSGNVCRCGTYLRIREAIHRAAGAGGGAS